METKNEHLYVEEQFDLISKKSPISYVNDVIKNYSTRRKAYSDYRKNLFFSKVQEHMFVDEHAEKTVYKSVKSKDNLYEKVLMLTMLNNLIKHELITDKEADMIRLKIEKDYR